MAPARGLSRLNKHFDSCGLCNRRYRRRAPCLDRRSKYTRVRDGLAWPPSPKREPKIHAPYTISVRDAGKPDNEYSAIAGTL